MYSSRSLVAVTCMAGALVACGGGEKAADEPPKTAADSARAVLKGIGNIAGGIIKMAEKQEALDQTNPYAKLKDPCVLVSRAEAEKYLGPLLADPYRVGGGKEPAPDGSACLYRGASGQSVKIEPTYSGGQMAMKMLGMTGRLTNQVFVDETGQADTLEGDWDDIRIDFGSVHALKGDVMIEVDATGSPSTGVVGSAALADIALRRLPHPLAYDGGAAARRAPGPLVKPVDPCTLVTAEEAAAILGPLVGPPRSTRDACSYPIKNPLGPLSSGPMEVILQVQWSGGWEALAGAKRTTASVMQNVGVNLPVAHGQVGGGGGGVETKGMGDATQPVDSDLEKMRKIMAGFGASTEKGSLQLKTDTTTLKGPWDAAAVLAGISFIAVKKDVSMAMDLRLLGEDKAIALVTKAMGRI
jgi:hypothetical protein